MTRIGLNSIPSGNELGEGILWDGAEGRFYWTDIQRSELWSCGPTGTDVSSISLPTRLASFCFTDQPGTILGAFDCGLATFSLPERRIDWICRPDLPPGVRFNDGRVDRSGRFVVGTMVEDADKAGASNLGKLYRLEPDGELNELLSDVEISNGLCFSPDGTELYHADTPSRKLFAYTYDTGALERPRLLKEFSQNEGPDGACVDQNGNIWIAIWGGGRVECLSPKGETLRIVHVDAIQPTCPTFGGHNLATLAITSASQGLELTEDGIESCAGDLFLIEGEARGLPEPRVRLT